MTDLNYAPIPRRSRESILASLAGGNPSEIIDALYSAAYWDDDWRWAQEQLLRFAEHDNYKVLWAVVQGLGYIAVFHGEIDQERVEPVLARLKALPTIAPEVEETEEEIDHFVRRRKAGENVSLGKRLPPEWRPPHQR